jgi:hypothetical protein
MDIFDKIIPDAAPAPGQPSPTPVPGRASSPTATPQPSQSSPQSGDDVFGPITPAPDQGPINPNAPEALPAPPGDPLSRFGQGFWQNTGAALGDAGRAVWDLMNVAGGDKKDLDPQTKQIWSNIINAHQDQAQKAKDAWAHGKHVEAAGHALATVFPLVGPMAAQAGEHMGDFQPATFDKYGNVIQPGQGPDIAGGLGEGMGMIFPSVAARVPGAIGQVAKMIPSEARAGAAFDQVMGAARNVPIDVAAPGQVALNIQQLAKAGGAMPKVVRDFLNRVTDPKQPPLTFEQARDFYSNASRLSADEFNRLTPNMKRQVGNFRDALDNSLYKAAGQAGKADLYRSAMNEYRKSMGMQRFGREVKSVAKSEIGKGLGIGAGSLAAGYLYNKLWGKAQGGRIREYPSRESVLASLQQRTHGDR